jgi:hypothetical protein
MSDYRPDRWVVIKITTPKEHLYKVFACWYGDSWKMNSGITQARLVDDSWEFEGYSGSVYSCYRALYGTTAYGGSVLQGLIDKIGTQGAAIKIMPEDTDWTTVPYDRLQQFVANGVENV